MNREEIIKGYTDNQKKYTWEALGSNVISSTTKLYNKGMIYKVEVSGSLEGCLVYCRNDYIGSLNWASASIIDTFSGEISFGSSIIDPNLISVMSKTEFDESDSSTVPDSFVPFQETLKDETGDVVISEDMYTQILSVLGYPYITEDELEYSREQICNIPLKIAIETYYRFFPREEIYSYAANGGVNEVEFPTGAYDALAISVQNGTAGNLSDVNISSTSGTTAGHTLWRTWTEYFPYAGFGGNIGGAGFSASMTGSYNSIYPPQTNQYSLENYLGMRSVNQAYQNYLHRYRFDKILKTDENGNSKWYARFFTNKAGGTVLITYAMRDYNTSHIDFARKSEFIKLCQAHVKLFFANLRSQAKPISGNITDYSTWKKEAEDTIKEVTELWQNIVKYRGVTRGTG